MKIPDIIYVADVTFPDYVDWDGSPINTKRIDDHDVEYTRTDAFIEKACEWLKKEVVEDYKGIVWENLIKDFKKYMKRE